MNIKQFIERLKTDSAFAGKYAALKGMDVIVEQAKADGFEITREDIERSGQKKGELTEDDLAMVAGGDRGATSGTAIDSGACWFQYSGNQQHWRKQCSAYCKVDYGSWHWDPFPWYYPYWTKCTCHGTQRCIDRWHIVDTCRVKS